MKKRTAFIGAILSLIPISQPLLFKTGVALSSSAVMLSLPQKVNAESAEFYFNRGYENMEEGDYYGAIANFNKLIKQYPYYSEIHVSYHNRGVSKESINDFSGALKDYEEAVLINSDYSPSFVGIGNMKLEFKEYIGALTAYDQAIRINSKETDAYIGRCNTKLSLKEYYGAISDCNKAIKLYLIT